MESDAFFGTDLHGNQLVMGFLNATLRDYAKFGLLYMNNGAWNGKQILSEQWVKESVTPDRKELQPGVASPEFGYQYQWWNPLGSDGSEFSAIGIWGQYIYVNQKEGVVIVKTSTDPDFLANEHETMIAFRAIADAVK
ncbi:serine hydrolase [Paenibacillus apiarius]|uniref:Beta-lactamase family protein n=1 Tax=Paenibacillus apiarius TaxID=46240 RepID=A0ABT4DZC6_9BACL|nr:serine hydrolase [Paenibacillus apiarius]MCY9517839.1 beta-lactamase family protein [Paenibacillus apiarius]MCY9522696.1 beta-lactamase family protein [Paenibacillus apiarius]MCY9555381.1 beta-lactamase family protein [Paenibacillus apiarius]MCY9561261.1 beta-lactamase family protein [Paenibacillus apiarius]MCY9686546.1 beta-lactamase family protein [Paenibacillus apiarius]